MKSIPHSTLLYTKYCNGNPIQEAESHEHLGLTFLMKCHLNDHLDTIIAKASRLNILWKNKYLLNRRSQELLVSWYFSYVRPLLEYADIIWKHIRHQTNQGKPKISTLRLLHCYSDFRYSTFHYCNKYSFLPSTVILLNNLPLHIQQNH